MMFKKLVQVGLLGAIGLLVLGLSAHADIIGDRKAKIYHAEGCPEIDKIEKPYLQVFDSEPEAEAHGYYPCRQCLPPLGESVQALEGRRKHALPITKTQAFIGDRKSKVLHQTWCPQVTGIATADKVVFKDIDQAWANQYRPCTECHPPVKPEKAKALKSAMQEKDTSALPEAELGTE